MKPIDVDKLVDQLAKPIYVLRMARPLELTGSKSMQKSARTRAIKARREIDLLVREYIERV